MILSVVERTISDEKLLSYRGPCTPNRCFQFFHRHLNSVPGSPAPQVVLPPSDLPFLWRVIEKLPFRRDEVPLSLLYKQD